MAYISAARISVGVRQSNTSRTLSAKSRESELRQLRYRIRRTTISSSSETRNKLVEIHAVRVRRCGTHGQFTRLNSPNTAAVVHKACQIVFGARETRSWWEPLPEEKTIAYGQNVDLLFKHFNADLVRQERLVKGVVEASCMTLSRVEYRLFILLLYFDRRLKSPGQYDIAQVKREFVCFTCINENMDNESILFSDPEHKDVYDLKIEKEIQSHTYNELKEKMIKKGLIDP